MKKIFLFLLTIFMCGFVTAPLSAQDCSPITVSEDNPWFEDFESYTGSGEQLFQCWIPLVSDVTYHGPFVYCGWANSCHSGNNSAEMKGANNLLILPEFTNPLTDLRLTFWATATIVSIGTLEVGVITDTTDETSFVSLFTCGDPGERGISGTDGNGNFMGPFDFNAATVTGRIALRYTSTSASQSWNLDDFTVSLIPACAEPSGLITNSVTAYSAVVTWNVLDGNIYDLLYWPANGDTVVVAGASLNDGVYSLDNLTPNTAYGWTVRTDCGDGSYANAFTTLSFTTPNVPVALPYEQDFETDPGSITDFTLTTNSSNAWIIGSATFAPEDPTDDTETGHSLYISNDGSSYAATYEDYSSYTNTNAYAILDAQFPENAVEWHISFDYKVPCTSSSYAYMSVYLVDASTDISTGSAPQGVNLSGQLNGVTNWTHADYILPNVTSSAKKIVFYWYNSYYAYYYASGEPAAIDNIEITSNSCAQPSGLAVTDLASDEATLTWVENGTATSWTVYWKEVGSEDDYTVESADDTAVTLYNLTPNTYYEFYVVAGCNSNPTPVFTFLTPNVSVELPYNRTFEEGDDNPVTEFTLQGTGDNQWAVGTATFKPEDVNDPTETGHSLYISNDNGVTNNYNTSNTSYAYAILDVVFNESLEYHLDFDYKTMGEGGYSIYDYLSVYIMDNNVEVPTNAVPSGTALLFQQYDVSDWTHVDLLLENVAGSSKKIVFFWKNDYTMGTNPPAAIDNISIQGFSCAAPSNLSVTDITASSATLHWQENGSATVWNVYYRPVGGSDWTMETVTNESLEITGLGGNTTYEIYVTADCSGEESSPSTTATFRTLCGDDGITVAAGAPWFEDFEGYTSSSFICWETPVTYTANNGTFPMVYRNYGESCHSGVNSAEFKGTEAMLVLPEFTNDINTLRLSFWATATSVTIGHIQIGVITDVTDTSTFELVIADAGTPGPRGSSNAGNGNYMGPFDFNGATATSGRIALRYIDPTGSGMYPQSWNLDDFTVELIPDCPSPVKTSVTATNIDGHNATISWTDNDPTHTAWTVYYKASTDSEWSTESASTTTVDLTDLVPETTYDVYVITDCGSSVDNPDATLTIHFTTLVACPAPQDLTVSNIGMTSATVTWFSNADSYTIEYGEAGFTVGEGTIVTSTTNSYDLNGLTSGTAYTVYVTADCGVDGTSQTATVNFSTNLCEVADQCSYTFNLSDSYGDGWNGASITIQQNGVTVATVGFTSYSYSATETVTLCDNQPTVLIWNSGSYDTECSFEVLSPSEDVIFTSTGLTSGTLTTFTSSCTPPTCPRPADITVSNIGATSVEVSWTTTGTENAWNVEYKVSTDATWTVIPVTTNPYTLTNLTSLTNYDVRVQADCGSGDVSDYRATSFSTAGCEVTDQCTYTFNLTDSYGDGWNGGTLLVQQNDVTVATISMSDGYTATETVNLCDNVSTSLVWSSTSYYAYEAGFSLLDPNGNELYSIIGMDNYTTYSFTTDCNGTGPVVTTPTVATDAASNITQTSAMLNGTVTNPDNVSVSPMGFEWKESSAIAYTSVNVTGATLAYNLDNLTSGTTYAYKAFITYNGMTYYGSEMTFTTLAQGVEPCDVPTGLTASDITHDGFIISWNANADVNNWNIHYRPQNGQWTSANANTNQYTVSGLTAETTYEVEVQADCGDNNLSEWSEMLSVTTQPNGIDNHLLNSITIYPNPAKDVVNVQCTMNNVQLEGVEVIDVYGKVVRTVVEAMCASSLQTRINVSGLASGMYFVRVTTNEGAVTKTFVKK